jgi:hypothetical protein
MLFRADELFQIKVDENAVFPLNISFDYDKNANQTLNQPGIFFMMYKGELIYIGYANREDALSRMKKQLEGITLRGKNVSFNEQCKSTVKNSETLKSFFSDSQLNRENSTQTSPKRILFAENHWQDFAFLDEDILKNFVFNWYPIDCDIPRKCNALKAVLKPRCNQEGLLQGDYLELVEKLNL